MAREERNIIGYTVALISEFALRFGIRPTGLRLPETLQGHGTPERALWCATHAVVPRYGGRAGAGLPKQWRTAAMIRLYHGSNQKIEEPDLAHSKPFKDFGCGFYLSPDNQQASAPSVP